MRRSLEATLRDAIRRGRLRADTPLPSSRMLASDLGIARNSVVEVYGQLVAEGWLVARTGSRTVVGRRPDFTAASAQAAPVTAASPVTAFDLRAGRPDVSGFPRSAWLAAGRRALHMAAPEVFDYQKPAGRPELREMLAEYLSRVRGLQVQADRVIICLGAMHGLNLIGRTLRELGATTWATESHGLAVHRRAAEKLGFMLQIVPVDEQGARVDHFGAADCVLLSPAHQFPLGVAMSAQRRHDAIEWAHTTNGILIEDDYDGEFRHDRRPVGALQALSPDRVIYVGTASKSLAPGLRIGWMVVPEHLREPLLRSKTLSDGHNSTFDQVTLAEFFRSGDYERHVRRDRLRYRRRLEQLMTTLAEFENVQVTGIAAGMHVLIRLPDGVKEDDVVARAGQRGLIVEGLTMYATAITQAGSSHLVIGYGTPPDRAYPGCLRKLAETLRELDLRPVNKK